MNAQSLILTIFILISSCCAASNRAHRVDFDESGDALKYFRPSVTQPNHYRSRLLRSVTGTVSMTDVVFALAREVALRREVASRREVAPRSSFGVTEATVNRKVSSGNLTMAVKNNAFGIGEILEDLGLKLFEKLLKE